VISHYGAQLCPSRSTRVRRWSMRQFIDFSVVIFP
jgi:hypothetical protein